MTLGEFRKLTAHLPDDTAIWYADINFGGLHEPVEKEDLDLDHNNILTIAPPYQATLDEPTTLP